MATFQFEISYAQLAVFQGGLGTPYNDWSDRHVLQGFAWRSESVSFRTLGDGELDVSVVASKTHVPRKDAVRAIEVPFEVPSSGIVEFGSIMETKQIELPSGNYALMFETGESNDGEQWATLTFRPVAAPLPARVVKADDELSPQEPLMMEAVPAS